MAEPLTDETQALIPPDHEEHETLQQSEDKQAVIEVTRIVTETEMEHGIPDANTNECPSAGLDTTQEGLETNPATEEVQEVGRGNVASDLAINIMSHMEISRLIANVVKRMQEDGSQSGVNTHNLFHMENLLKQIVTNQNTITINQNSLLRNLQAVLHKVDMLSSLMVGVIDDPRLAEKSTTGLKSNYNAGRGGMSSPRPGARRSFGMDGTAALVQAAEQVAMITGSPGSVGMSVGQTLNGVTTTGVISQDGNVEQCSGDEEQTGFGSTSQTTTTITALSTISPSAIYLAAGSMSPDQLMQQSKTASVNEVQLIRLKARSQSVGNFAVHLVRELFKPHELMLKNVSGTRSKDKLDPERVAKIRKYVFDLFPTSEFEEDKVWGECRKAMDEFLRRPNKRKNQERLSQGELDYSMNKKDKLTDNQIMETP